MELKLNFHNLIWLIWSWPRISPSYAVDNNKAESGTTFGIFDWILEKFP